MAEFKKNPNKIGGIWKKENEKGQYMSGQIEIDGIKTDFFVYDNNYKTTDKQPDYVIFKKLTKAEYETKKTEKKEFDVPF